MPSANMHRLAAQGLRLTSTYSQPSCTPTGAALLTGQLPIRTGLLRPTLPGEGGSGLGGAATIPQILKSNAYVTQAIGKWHLGGHKDAQPQNVGFEHYFGQLTSSDDYSSFREPWRNPKIANDPKRRRCAEASEELAIVAGKTGMKASQKPFFLYFATRGAHVLPKDFRRAHSFGFPRHNRKGLILWLSVHGQGIASVGLSVVGTDRRRRRTSSSTSR